jgi:predicted lipoprotein with Yx(FWY)xxD motif
MLGFPNRGLVVGVMVVLIGLVAGCGGGSSHSTQTNGGVAGTKKSSAMPSAMFSTAKVAGVGTVLVDGQGRTVYILTTGGHTNVPCTDSSGCTKLWPDLPLPSGTSAAKAGMGVKPSLLGTKKLSDGETYPTYSGWLMYEYTGDSGPGQANGEGIKSFGGTWYVLSPSGQPIKSASGGSSNSGGAGGGGGY